jgi:hypothetical protein
MKLFKKAATKYFKWSYDSTLFFLLLVQKKETKKKTPRKPTASLLFHTNHRVNAEQLAVRTFRGHQPHV